jgi:hypothetical protein
MVDRAGKIAADGVSDLLSGEALRIKLRAGSSL